MSKEVWAAIVYGRSYHLDFRFITIPQDFERDNLTWASQHILATTRQARNLAERPRWSLFKNNSHCIVGVTCMVRDLIGQLGEDSTEVMAKDDLGRPLYAFVGYVTQLDKKKSLLNFPAYTGTHLAAFKPLYQQIEKVWLVKDYQKNSRQPLLSKYEALNSSIELISAEADVSQSIKLNNKRKRPNQVFLWSNSTEQNNQLWIASAKCSTATSVCLDIKGKFISDSPFLNQSITPLDEFTICDRLASNQKNRKSDFFQKTNKNPKPQVHSLPRKISTKAKEDIGLTLEQAAKVAIASQEFINQLGDRPESQSSTQNVDSQNSDSQLSEGEFGFKTKKSEPLPQDRDWF